MGIELHPTCLSLTGTRCYQPFRESIVAKCCQNEAWQSRCHHPVSALKTAFCEWVLSRI